MKVYRGISSVELDDIRKNGIQPELSAFNTVDDIDSTKIPVVHVTSNALTSAIYAFEHCYSKLIGEETEHCTEFKCNPNPKAVNHGGRPVVLELNISKKELHQYYSTSALGHKSSALIIARAVKPSEIKKIVNITATYQRIHEQHFREIMPMTIFGSISEDEAILSYQYSRTTHIDEKIAELLRNEK